MTTFAWWAAFGLSFVLLAGGVGHAVRAPKEFAANRLTLGVAATLAAVVLFCAGMGLLGLTAGHGLTACDSC